MELHPMRNRASLILALVAGIACATGAAAEALDIIRAEFGVFDASNPRELVFEPAIVVPLREGQRYGWIIELVTTQRALSVREEYLLPMPERGTPDPLSESLGIPLVRRNQVSQRQLVPVAGKIYGEWAVGPAEPPGHRHLQVLVEGQVAASFEFDVK
jgi:hypothetical protein